MVMPNFLVIGAAKAGTTSLFTYLKQHPQVFVPALKEPRFFALEGQVPNYKGPVKIANKKAVNNIDDYRTLFQEAGQSKAIGEASTIYLYEDKTASRIKSYVPDCKLIAILRNPIDRAFSSYSHLVRDGFENLSFEAALNEEEKRIQDNWPPLWHYNRRGFYYLQVKRYLDIFDASQFKIYLYEDLLHRPEWLISDIYQFLGVDDSFRPDLASKENISGTPKNKFVSKILTGKNPIKTASRLLLPKATRGKLYKAVKQKNLGKKQSINPHTRQRLISLFRDDINLLSELIQRDLSDWLTDPKVDIPNDLIATPDPEKSVSS